MQKQNTHWSPDFSISSSLPIRQRQTTVTTRTIPQVRTPKSPLDWKRDQRHFVFQYTSWMFTVTMSSWVGKWVQSTATSMDTVDFLKSIIVCKRPVCRCWTTGYYGTGNLPYPCRKQRHAHIDLLSIKQPWGMHGQATYAVLTQTMKNFEWRNATVDTEGSAYTK